MRNLVKLYNAIPERDGRKQGDNWYQLANQYCSDLSIKYNIPIANVVAVLSALSPGTNWERNQDETKWLIEASLGNKRKFKFTTYGANVLKAHKALKAVNPELLFSEKTGAKTFNFYHNILNPDNPDYCTIDRHAYTIATNEVYKGLSPKGYRTIADGYKRAAKRLGILPNVLQSVLWVDYRNRMFPQVEVPF